MLSTDEVFRSMMVRAFVPVIPGRDGATVPTEQEVGMGVPVRGGSEVVLRVETHRLEDEMHGSGEVPEES